MFAVTGFCIKNDNSMNRIKNTGTLCITQNLCKVLLWGSIVCLSFSSCTNYLYEKRPQRFKHNFRQGTADHLYNISEILGDDPVLESKEIRFAPLLPENVKNKDSQFPPLSSKGGYPKDLLNKNKLSNLLKIKTVQKGEKVAVSFVQDNIHIDPEISFINKYEIIDYKISSSSKKTEWHSYIEQLLGRVKTFKGFPDTTYYILPLFVGNYLVLYKIGPANKIPYDELPLAKRVGAMLAVPFVGYPVKFCVARVIPDVNERETGQYEPKCEGIKLEYAKYIQLKEGNKQVFNYLDKPDLFPKDFFTVKKDEKRQHNWFYVRTVVKSPKNKSVGHQLFEPANLVEFHPRPGKVDVLDASGYQIRAEDKLRTLFIPVEWVDYQIKRDSENLHTGFSEELKLELKTHEKNLKNLRYFKIKFKELVENETELKGEKTLKNVFITNDYFSFNVEITEKDTGAYLVKYAFFKKPVSEYVQKQWFEQDSALFFPAFSGKRRYYKDPLDYSQADHDRFLRTTRFNPKLKEIKWYFSKQTPRDAENSWVRALGHLAEDLLNKAFQEAGRDSEHKIKIVLDESGDKEVGDIRYNILNLIVTEGKSNSGLLGLGPNVANPITGEVVSATANVWVSNILNIYISAVRKYIRFQIYPPAWKLRAFSREVTDSLKEKIAGKNSECNVSLLQPLGVTPFIHERITNLCSEVTDFIKQQKEKGLAYDPENPSLQDKNIIKSCAKKLAFLPILGTILHEMQHGFAQRHVFSASVDTDNFYKDYDEIKRIFGTVVSDTMKEIFREDLNFDGGTKCHPEPPKYSSLMDYMDLYNPFLFVPGKLDIAALRFIYFDKVDLKGGGVLEVPSGADKNPIQPQKSILKKADSEGLTKEDLKSYKVLCGGDSFEKAGYTETSLKQPLCTPFDYGANPLEVVINNITLINNIVLMNGRNRYDSENIRFNPENKNSFFSSQIQRLGNLYGKWKQYRDELLDQKNHSIEDYSFLNSEDIDQYKNIMEEGQANNPDFKKYYDIRKPIFDYFQRLLFLPAKHCIYKKHLGSGKFQLQAIALENILVKLRADYNKFPENSREKFIDCNSPAVKTWAHSRGKGELVTEVGFFKGDMKYFIRPKANQDPYDERSALKIWPVITDNNDFLLDMIMEPDFGEVYYKEVQDYVLQGSDLYPYMNEDVTQDLNIPRDKETERVNFDRFLTYKIDRQSPDIFLKRLSILESVVQALQSRTANKEFKLQFGKEARQLIDIAVTAESIENNGEYPFFSKAYEDYKKDKDAIPLIDSMDQPAESFASFLRNHPETLHSSINNSLIIVPYEKGHDVGDEPAVKSVNFPARVFKRLNGFMKCIENENEWKMTCTDKEEKTAFVENILRYYYEQALEKKESADEEEEINRFR